MGTRYNRLVEAVLTSTHNLCFERKYEKYQSFLSENFQYLKMKFSIYLNRRVFVMTKEPENINYTCPFEISLSVRIFLSQRITFDNKVVPTLLLHCFLLQVYYVVPCSLNCQISLMHAGNILNKIWGLGTRCSTIYSA